MQRREMIDQAQLRMIDATKHEDVREAVADLDDYLNKTTRSKSAQRAELENCMALRQPINSALTELALRNTTEVMAMYFRQAGTLLHDNERDQNKIFEEYSPTLRRFMGTMHAWFEPALTQVIWEGKQGKMPNAALLEEGEVVHMRRYASDRWWCKYRAQNNGGVPWLPGSRFLAGAQIAAVEANIPHITSAVLGRALADTDTTLPNEKAGRILAKLDKITDFNSVITPVSKQALGAARPFLNTYSQWEEGEICDDELFENISSSPWFTTGNYHRSIANGRWESPGTCTVDSGISRPERFAIPPSEFLGTLGVDDPGYITLSKLYTVPAVVIARDGLFKSLPVHEKVATRR